MVYTVADEQGRFVVDGLEQGNYRLCASDPSETVTQACYLEAASVDDAQTFHVYDGQVVSNIRLEMALPEPNQTFLPIVVQ